MGRGDDGDAGFEWWVPHDRALRRARALFLLGALVAATYVIAPFAVLLLAWRDSVRFDAPAVLVIAGGVIAVVAAVASMIALVAWCGLSRVTVALAGARSPTAEEERVLAAPLDGVALARGITRPAIWVIDDDAPNAFAAGRAGRASIGFTRGALTLPYDELEALCAFELSAICSRPFAYCAVAIDIVLFCETCVSLLWALAGIVLVSAAAGVPPEIAALATLCIAGLIVATRFALVVADRALPRLLDDVTGLVDLEAIGTTEQPAPFGRLLARVSNDGRRVGTRWPIAHRWFDRDEVEVEVEVASRPPVTTRSGARRAWVTLSLTPGAPVLARRCEQVSADAVRRRAARVRHLSDGSGTGPRRAGDEA